MGVEMRTNVVLLFTIILLNVVSPIKSQSFEFTIMASHSILADVIANVVGDVATVERLIPLGADPHAFQPSSRDLARVASVDIIVINGALFEEGLLDTIENVASETPIITASSCIEMRLFDFEESEHEEEIHVNEELNQQCNAHYAELNLPLDSAQHRLYELDCGDDEFQAEANHDHEHNTVCDPHVWTVPQNVMLWTLLIRDILSEADSLNADTYFANANSYIEQLQELENNFIQPELEGISPENRILVTNHDSLGYFADAYNFEIVSTVIPGGSTLAETSASSIVTVIEQINSTGVSAIFTETTMSEDIAQQIANETGAEIYQLYSGALGQEGSPAATYLDYMRYNVTTIADALSDAE